MKWGYSSLSVLRFPFSPLLLGPVLPESCSTWTILRGKAYRGGWAQGHWVAAPWHHPGPSSSCPGSVTCWPWPSGHRSHGHRLIWQHLFKEVDLSLPMYFLLIADPFLGRPSLLPVWSTFQLVPGKNNYGSVFGWNKPVCASSLTCGGMNTPVRSLGRQTSTLMILLGLSVLTFPTET